MVSSELKRPLQYLWCVHFFSCFKLSLLRNFLDLLSFLYLIQSSIFYGLKSQQQQVKQRKQKVYRAVAQNKDFMPNLRQPEVGTRVKKKPLGRRIKKNLAPKGMTFSILDFLSNVVRTVYTNKA